MFYYCHCFYFTASVVDLMKYGTEGVKQVLSCEKWHSPWWEITIITASKIRVTIPSTTATYIQPECWEQKPVEREVKGLHGCNFS